MECWKLSMAGKHSVINYRKLYQWWINCVFPLLVVPAVPVVAKIEMNIVVKNPEIVFVADLTRAEAPALVMTTQCELVIKNEPSGQSLTAAISDLKVVACPLLREKREHNVTTVLQPCQVFFQSNQSPSQPQTIELSISSLTLKVRLNMWNSDDFIFWNLSDLKV